MYFVTEKIVLISIFPLNNNYLKIILINVFYQIYTASYLSARYIKENYPDTKKVYVLAPGTMADEFDKVGIEAI